ncbi:MAG TPA: hypothetical protein VIS73_12270 [Rhodocyclaceae bacterium]
MPQSHAVSGWRFFWLAATMVSLAMIVAMARADLASAAAISSLIQLSVRCAVPWLYLAFAASSVQAVFPGAAGRWLLMNRKYIGLVFAAAMAWQGFFILWLVVVHTDYYVEEVYVLRDAIEGVVGYLFLALMTITSFGFARRRLSARSWKLLHTAGIYYLWGYAFIVYWWALFIYRNPVLLDYVYYWGGFAACCLRAAAWGKRQLAQSEKRARFHPSLSYAGFALVGLGLLGGALGSLWQPLTDKYLYGYEITRIPELYLPYWPFEPFLPLAIIAAGIYLVSRAGDQVTPEAQAV